METTEAILKRASLKARLSEREIEPEKINRVLEAATLAPSARNFQPWQFIVIKDKQAREKVVEAFADANQLVKKAPVIIIVCGKPDDSVIRDGKEYYLLDIGMATENMLLAATELGLVTHPMTGIDEAKLKNILGIPAEVRFVIATPLAYPDAASYDEAAKERLRERTRKCLEDITYSETWGNKS